MRGGAVRAPRRRRAVLRPQQGRVRRLRFSNSRHRTLRRLLLPAGRARGADCGAARRALVRALLDAAPSHVRSATAARASTAARPSLRRPMSSRGCCRIRLVASPSRRAAASSCRLRRRWPRPIACSATRSCTPFSSTSRGGTAATPDSRCGSSRAWPNTCRAVRSTPNRRCGCATPCCSERIPAVSRATRRVSCRRIYMAMRSGRISDSVSATRSSRRR